jgi:hypothetical protein
MADKLEIMNVALARIGANSITSETEGSTEARLVVNHWSIARLAVLREHAWNFAATDVELAQVAGYAGFEFKYAYALPADCVRLLQFYGNPTFRVQGGRVLTNEPVCKIKYVADITDTSKWDASFSDVLAQRLAVDIAYALTKSQAAADSAYALYTNKLRVAKHTDATEDTMDALGGDSSIYIAARY